MGAFGANSRNVPNSVNLLTLSSERSRNDCGVAKNSNADWISELCYTVCPRTGVLKSSDDTLCNFERGLFPQRRWENATHTASRHSVSLPVLWNNLDHRRNLLLNLGSGHATVRFCTRSCSVICSLSKISSMICGTGKSTICVSWNTS